MSDFAVKYSPEVLGTLVDKAIIREQQVETTLDQFAPELNALENEAAATMRAFQGQIDTIGSDQEDIYNKLAKTRGMPLNMGKLLGLVLPEYNEEVLLTRAGANAAAMENSSRKSNAALSLIGQRAKTIESRIGNEMRAAELQKDTLGVVIQGLTATLQYKDKVNDLNKSLLMAVPPKQLQEALAADRSSPTVKINGKDYDRGVASAALDSRNKIDAEVLKSNEELKHARLTNTQLAGNIMQERVERIASEYTLTDMEAAKNHVGPDGNIVIQSSIEGEAFAWNYEDFRAKWMAKNELMKGARETTAKMETAAERLSGEAITLTDRANRIATLAGVQRDAKGKVINTGDTPYNTEMLLATESVNEMGTRYALAADNIRKGKPNPDDISMFNGNTTAKFQALHDRLTGVIDKNEKSLMEGASTERKAALGEMINQGRIVSAATAIGALGESLYMPSDFTGPYAILGTYIQGFVDQKGKERRGVKLTADGKLDLKDPATMKMLMMTGVQREDATTKYLDADQYMQENGIGGLKGAYLYAGTDYILNTAVNNYLRAAQKDIQSKSPLATQPANVLEGAILANGQWSPEFIAYRNKLGPTYGLMQYIIDKEAPLIAAGKLAVNENTATRISSYVATSLQEGSLRLPAANTPALGALDKIVYDNKPSQGINQIVQSVFNRAPDALLNAIKRTQDTADDAIKASTSVVAQRWGVGEKAQINSAEAVADYYKQMQNRLGGLK
jgi:hypothetical protein